MGTKTNGAGTNQGEYKIIGSRNDHEEDPLIWKGENNPYETSSWWNKLVFGWLSPLLELGKAKGQLDKEDLNLVPFPDAESTARVRQVFEACWEAEVQHGKSKDRDPSLVRALWLAFYSDFCKAGILKFVHDLLQFVGPQVLNRLIKFIRDPDAPLSRGLSLTAIVTLAQLCMSLCLRHYFFKCYRVGIRIRSAVITSVYQKAFDVSSTTKSSGEITNLMSVDAQRLQEVVTYAHSVWYSPLQIGLAIFFLWGQLGISCLAGVGVIILSVPLTAFSANWMGRLQNTLMTAKDRRIEVNNEILGNMRVVKLQAWEQPFQEKLEQLRENEVGKLFLYLIGRSVTFLMWSAVPLMISLSTFGTYVLLGNPLDVASALTSLALFEILRFPLFMLPNVINQLVEAGVSVSRIASFLNSPDHKPVVAGDLEGVGAEVSGASFVYENVRPVKTTRSPIGVSAKLQKELADSEWELQLLKSQLASAEQKLSTLEGTQSYGATEEKSLLALSRINLGISEGEFIVIVGAVGSGKSSLLKALLGEVRQLSGTVKLNGKISYFVQSPFIMNDTVEGNILFGKEGKNKSLYEAAISTCALAHDLTLLPQGDLTEIGEKGITLSGGQKARIAMARALYHDADLYFLDDPLAAVDANVGRHLFQECIVNEMLLGKTSQDSRKKTVVLVTNALQYLSHPLVDKIIVLSNGQIVESGSYGQLTNNEHSTFKKYMESFNEKKTGPSIEQDTEKIIDLQPQSDLESKEFATTLPSEGTKSSGDDGDAQLHQVSLMTDEMQERETGEVSLKVYLTWANAAGGLWVVAAIMFAYILGECTRILSNWWLTYWSRHSEDNQLHFLFIYGIINVCAIFVDFTRVMILLHCSLRASRTIFSRVLDSTMKAPMSFFDTTPLGRIVNRFSKDMYTVDEGLPGTFDTCLACMFEVISTIVVVSSITPMFTVSLLPVLYFYQMQQQYFRVSYREFKRIDSVSRSPIYALFGETLDGISTIRAFSAQDSLLSRMAVMLDNQQHAYFLTSTAQCWLAVRLELIGTSIVFSACLAAVLNHGSAVGDAHFAGLAGLSISYSLAVTQSLNWLVRVFSDLEANLVSLERLEQYSKIPSEADRSTPADARLQDGWPMHGALEFKNATLRYRPGLPLVLKGLDISIPGNSSVGIVGRTGAGKSSLMTALMRLVELDGGQILLDGVDTRTLGLRNLRSAIAVIPQDPVLFSGTVGDNLDPFNTYTQDRLTEVLQRVGLMSTSNSKVQSLADPVMEGGNNFSVGEKQLLVIARALLSRASLIICDEATAAVDAETDSMIQKILKSEFQNATCLTIAHRLNTIMDSDMILVMNDGKAAEFNSPQVLLEQDGIFKTLVQTWEEQHGH